MSDLTTMKALLLIEGRDAFMAVWTALTQYIENQEPEEEWTAEVRREVEAARTLIAQCDKIMAQLADGVEVGR